MFHIRVLRRADFDFAVELANTMDWNMAPEDFEFAQSLEPKGSFLLLDFDEKLGVATAISYGAVGWFGNLILKETCRGRGGGKELVQHAIDYLHGKGVQTIGLYAYPHLTGFYGDLGFKQDTVFSVLHTKKAHPVTAPKQQKVTAQLLPHICHFDRACFGGDRTRLLQTIVPQKGNLSYAVVEGGEVVGYVAATVYPTLAWVGPLVCQPQRSDVAVSLVRAVLSGLAGKDAYAVVPKANSALAAVFAEAGFTEDFYVVRMFLGEAAAKNCIYMAESLERG
jgi:predicted N-acetyltransferase YhbS